MMASAALGACDHCTLSLGAWPFSRQVDGISRRFCCYGCFIVWQVGRGGGEEAVAAGLLIRLGVGAFLAMNIMLFSLLLYSGGIAASDPVIRQAFHYGLLVFATPAMIILGGPFVTEALTDLSRGRLSGASLISIGALAAYGYSLAMTVTGGDKVYFDTATMVLGLFTLGRFLEASARARALRNLAPMLRPGAQTVTVISDGRPTAKPLAEVGTGDVIRVLPGEAIAVDGLVIEGTGCVDQSWLTGESRPAEMAPGGRVLAGTLNLDGVLILRCSAGGLETRWAAVCAALLEALSGPTAIRTVTDRLAVWFVPAVLAVALATLWIWSTLVPFEQALMHGLAVLVVACPCALGLAAPLATALALDRLARVGCVLRSGEALFDLAGVERLAIDKTGTLTLGAVRVTEVISEEVAPEALLMPIGALELSSRHPLARGVVEALVLHGETPGEAKSVRAVPGRGVIGTVDGRRVAAGSARWFDELGWRRPEGLSRRLAQREDAGCTVVCAGWNGSLRGGIVFGDVIRSETRAAVAALEDMGIQACILSGDSSGPVAAIAAQAGVGSWRAGLLPEDKAAFIRAWKRPGAAVAMIGDGINDGLALQAADVGIAVGDGIDLARETADVVLPGEGLAWLPGVIALARRTKRRIHINLAWAFGYNAVAIALAASGLLQPVIAAALMAGSSLVVIANSFRLEPVSKRMS